MAFLTTSTTQRWLATVALGLAIACELNPGDGDQTPSPPEPEEAMLSVVPLDSLRNVRFPWYTADGSRILASAQSDEFAGTQIVSF